MRKLNFGANDSSRPAKGGAGSSSVVTGETMGLPSLLKKLRQDAQQEIERATAHVVQIVSVFTRELRFMEGEVVIAWHNSEARLSALCSEISSLESDADQLRQRVSGLEEVNAGLGQRNAELLIEMAEVREEARQANERAGAMEAASVFLQTEDNDNDGADFEMLRQTEALFGEADEMRAGGRSISGAVALANVPAVNGGCERFPSTAECQTGDGNATENGRSLGLVYVGASPWKGGGRQRADSAGKGMYQRTQAPGVTPAEEAGEPTPRVEASKGKEGKDKDFTSRKFSFSRKAGRKIVRSLSFGSEPPKRDVSSSI